MLGYNYLMNLDDESSIKKLQDLYVLCHDELDGDIEGRLLSQRYLNSSTALYHGEVIGVGFIPKLYDMPSLCFMDAVVNTTYEILKKITARFIADADYRKLFGFSPLLEKLICLSTGYKSIIPIMRMDIFLNEESFEFKFCEFNTDGTSGMNEDREAEASLVKSTVYQSIQGKLRLQQQELFDGWVDEFLSIYFSSEQAVDNPCIAIVDFFNSASLPEFIEFKHRFEARGFRTIICDVTNLIFEDGSLYANKAHANTELLKGTHLEESHQSNEMIRINAVYRRAVTGEILSALEIDPSPNTSAGALISAVEQKSICMIGGFVTHVAHCKQLFSILHHPQTAAFLSQEENDFILNHVPYTARLKRDEIDFSKVVECKDNWIIKPEDGYASQGVYAGIDYDKKTWSEHVEKCSELNYIVQTFCPQYATANSRIVPADDKWKPLFYDASSWLQANERYRPSVLEKWNNLTGMYVYDGKLSGLFVRAGQSGIIAGFAGGITLAAMLCDYDPNAGLALRTKDNLVAGKSIEENLKSLKSKNK